MLIHSFRVVKMPENVIFTNNLIIRRIIVIVNNKRGLFQHSIFGGGILMNKILNEQDRLNQIIGRNIKFYRELYNINNSEKMTQAKLAKLIGVSTPLIGLLESNNTTKGISTYNLYKISKVLNVSIDKFYDTPVIETIVDDLKKAK